MRNDNVKIVATNRKAHHEYHIEETLEAGLVLSGTEIKSIRAGRVNIREAYVAPRDGEMWVLGMHIAHHEPLRPRKLLMHRREIDRWAAAAQQKGYTIVPLRLYLHRGRAKLEIGLAKGKKLYDKREAIAERDSERRIRRALREHERRR